MADRRPLVLLSGVPAELPSGDALITSGVNEGFTTTATAAGTTTLALGATYTQVFTGSAAQTVKLPTTSILQGQQYLIINLSTGAVTVQSSGANTIAILALGTSAIFTALVATPTTAANWNALYAGSIIASGKSLSVSNILTFTGTDGSSVAFGAGGTVVYSGGPTQTALTLNTGWSNFGGAYQTAIYSKDEKGLVKLGGLVTGSSANYLIATLPAGYRPSAKRAFPVVNGTGAAWGSVDSAGLVTLESGNNATYVSLDGISFYV
jgi:hypothetical protein